jgi:hypothetical protein
MEVLLAYFGKAVLGPIGSVSASGIVIFEHFARELDYLLCGTVLGKVIVGICYIATCIESVYGIQYLEFCYKGLFV